MLGSGDGIYQVTARCDGSLAGVKIDPAAVSPDDVSMLEDMILTAANQAIGEAKEIYNSEMGKVSGGMGLPGMILAPVILNYLKVEASKIEVKK